MQSVYTIYFNNGEEVTPLCYCNGYSHAEELMENVANEFMKINYTGRPLKICKYEEGSTVDLFLKQLYKDASFPEGIVFVQKKHEATVYEKTVSPGYLGVNIISKRIGCVGVMSQQYEFPLYLKQQLQLITQQETIIKHLENDLKRADYQIARSDIELDQLRDMLNRHMEEKKSVTADMNILNIRLVKMEEELAKLEAENFSLNELINDTNMSFDEVPKAPEAPVILPKKIQTDLNRKNVAIAPVLNELKDAVLSGSWRKSNQLKALYKLKNDEELQRMIAEIDAIVLESSNKIKTE